MNKKPPISYKESGVDIDAGNELVERIKPLVARTLRPEVMAGLGGFGGLFALPPGRWQEPVLVAGTDGVGTKLKLAQTLGQHDTIGIDLVAMCVNDVLVQGAEPLFFLDYFATGKLDQDVATRVIAGIAKGCEQAGCALIGGETAEMPDMYAAGEYDLAGFNVGVVERQRLIDGHSIAGGDQIIGLAASGPHANGYSLIRKIIQANQVNLDQRLGEQSLGQALLAPTHIYVTAIQSLLSVVPIHGMAHITGGGLRENIIRIVPPGLAVEIDAKAWPRPAVFNWLQAQGIETMEMLRTFNCGIGYTVIVPPDAVAETIANLTASGFAAWHIGRILADLGSRVRFVNLT